MFDKIIVIIFIVVIWIKSLLLLHRITKLENVSKITWPEELNCTFFDSTRKILDTQDPRNISITCPLRKSSIRKIIWCSFCMGFQVGLLFSFLNLQNRLIKELNSLILSVWVELSSKIKVSKCLPIQSSMMQRTKRKCSKNGSIKISIPGTAVIKTKQRLI